MEVRCTANVGAGGRCVVEECKRDEEGDLLYSRALAIV